MEVNKKTFCFVVLTYNHEDYIVEHLESIKYLIENYGRYYDVSIIVNDDASTDETVDLISRWIAHNSSLFCSVNVIFNEKNIGTCKSLCNVFKKISSDYCKLTAGDDVYSSENLFDLTRHIDDYDIVSGVPIRLIDGELRKNHVEVLNTIASSLLFDNKQVLHMTESVNFINAPNAIYSVKYLKDVRILDFLSGFDVVEDLPIQIFISDMNIEAKFLLVSKVYVYYRRTSGSAYIVVSNRVRSDVLSIYRYLLKRSCGGVQGLLLRNRRYCYLIESKYLKKLLNLTLYLYAFRIIFHFRKVAAFFGDFNVDIDIFNKHLELIKGKAKIFNDHSMNL